MDYNKITARTISYYVKLKEERLEMGYDQITDLITDLLHYANDNGYDPSRIIENVQMHLDAETQEGRAS